MKNLCKTCKTCKTEHFIYANVCIGCNDYNKYEPIETEEEKQRILIEKNLMTYGEE